MTVLDAQFGVKDEVTYGTPTVTDHFYEIESIPSFKPEAVTIDSKGHRAGDYMSRRGRSRRIVVGASGDVSFPVPTRNFAWWLKHLMGTVATGATADSNTTFTGTVGSLVGDFFTAQVGRPFNPSGTVQAFTYHGGKVTKWEASCDRDDQLMISISCDFEDVDTSTGLAVASYASGATIFDFTGAAITIGGASVEMSNVTFGIDNKQNTGRRFLRGTRLKKEPVTSGMREVTWSGDLEFTSNAQYDRFVSDVNATNHAAIVMTFTGPIAHAGATLPTLTVTIPEARFDDVGFSTSLDSDMTQSISGLGMVPTAGGSAMTLVVVQPEATL